MVTDSDAPRVLVCLQCGEVLSQIKCKARCPRCGYFEDCSDGGTNLHQETVYRKPDPPRSQ